MAAPHTSAAPAADADGAPPADADDADERSVTFVEEADELLRLANSIGASGGAPDERAYTRIASICSKYQEQPQLLDPHLEGVLAPLTAVLRAAARAAAAADAAAPPNLAAAQRAARLLQLLASLRGYKTVVKFFPHEAADLEPALALLRASDASRGAAGEDEEGAGAWETRSVLLLWLSILVLIPFGLATVDSSLKGGAGDADATPPVVHALLAQCRGFLSEPGIVRDMAAATLARLLTRPDMGVPLAEFLQWCREALRANEREGTGGADATFLVPGAAAALAGLLKRGARKALAASAASLWDDVAALAASPAAARSPLLRKRAAQLAQRVALLLLPPRPRAWRYQRTAASLHANLRGGCSAAPTATLSFGAAAEAEAKAATAAAPGAAPAAAAAADEDADDAEEVPEAVEAAFELLLCSLRDSDTVVRWAAAKGVGRLAARLPGALADQVLDSLLELFVPTQPDGAWHGGCLALAELARRGALLPRRLGDVAPRVAAALRYDVRRGPHSVGAHVRDAAAYVAWAAARAYAPAALAPAAAALAPPLLAVACYDREVNCRRAAAAAFQECVGRLGGLGDADVAQPGAPAGVGIAHGIAVVGMADYFSIGPRSSAYLRVAPRVASYDAYRRHLAEHLEVKLQHWDAGLRALSADALAALAALEREWMVDTALPMLLPRTLAAEPGARHGALLALAAVLPALCAAGAQLPPPLQAQLVAAVPALEKARLYRGKGGEMVRGAAAALVGAVARAGLPASPAQRAQLMASAEESLRHPAAEVQAVAAAAVAALVQAHCAGAAEAAAAARRHAAALARDPNPAARRGAALALAALPARALAPAWRAVAAAAAHAATPEEDVAARDAETRVNAIKALGALIDAVGVASDADASAPPADDVLDVDAAAASADDAAAAAHGLPAAAVAHALLPALLHGLDDYCTDNRGDVGSWVREAAMQALPRCCAALAAAAPCASPGAPRVVAAALLKQAGEKIDRVRAAAADALAVLLRDLLPSALASVPHAAALAAVFPPPPGGTPFGVPAEAFPALAPLLRLPEYRAALVSGMIVAVGGIGDSLSKTASAALLAAAAPASAEAAPSPLACDAAGDVVAALAAAPRTDRVATPALRTLDVLYAHAGLAGAPEALHAAAVAATAAATKAARDIPKLCAAASLLAHIAGVAAAAPRADARRQLCGLMAGPYPRVRRAAAEALYLRLAGDDGDDAAAAPGEQADAAAETLAAARWDAAPEEVRATVAAVYAQLALGPLPAALQPGGAGGAVSAAAARRAAKADEHDSYRSLVDTAGY